MKTIRCFNSHIFQLLATTMMLFSSFLNINAQKTSGTVTDVDGNRYITFVVGNQEWMMENLKTTKYNDGSDIPLEVKSKAWISITTPAYCWYGNDIANKDLLGALYNWYTVNTGKLCPSGWHIPSDKEWTQLTELLGGIDVAGEKIKEATIKSSKVPNAKPNNEIGIKELLGGYRYGYFWGDGNFYENGLNGYFWTATEYTKTHSITRTVNNSKPKIYRSVFVKNNGFYVRCVKD